MQPERCFFCSAQNGNRIPRRTLWKFHGEHDELRREDEPCLEGIGSIHFMGSPKGDGIYEYVVYTSEKNQYG